RSVRHKEILHMIGRGVTVLGAASMGALRAAELDQHGMVGVGRIYQAYRSGQLTADDEVALNHGPEESGYRPVTEALVNIRATLAAAVAAGVISAASAETIVQILGGRPYGDRTYRAVLAVARSLRLPLDQVDALHRHCADHPINQKRADALELVA